MFLSNIKKNPVFLSLVIIATYYFLAYFLLIQRLGFYSEDVFVDYIWHFLGQDGILLLTSTDRPSHGYLLNILFNFLGDNILFWHIYTFIIRLAGGYFLFFLLNKVWPKKIAIVTLITLLFLVYPGFLQQTLPLGYGIWLSTLTIWILSLLFTVYAIFAAKNKEKFKFIFLLILSIILQGISILLLEFFIGPEILRIFLIFYILNSKEIISIFPISNLLKKIFLYLKYFLPYIATILVFLFWRIFIFKSTRDITDINYVAQTFYSDPIWIAKIPVELLHSFLQTVVFAYFIPLLINFIRIPIENSLVSIIIGFCAGSFIYLYLNKLDMRSKGTKSFGLQILILGIIIVFFALIPIIVAGRYARVYLVYDRYTMSSIIGVAFIIVGLLLFKIKSKIFKFLFVIILSLSLASQLMNGYFRVQNWEKQKDIWWQLYWRSPQIKENAMLVFYFPELTKQNLFKDIINEVQWYRIYWVDYQIWRLGNLFFNYNNPFSLHFNGDFLSNKDVLQKIQNKTSETVNDSNLVYPRYFANSIIILSPSDNSCLWVLNNKINELPEYSNEILKSAISYSDINKLVKENSVSAPPSKMFGDEPKKNWCYYFQKADLARQEYNWTKLAEITNDVFNNHLQPLDINEWLPFLEGLIVNKKYIQAEKLLKWLSQNYESSVIFNTNLCNMSKRLNNAKMLISYCN